MDSEIVILVMGLLSGGLAIGIVVIAALALRVIGASVPQSFVEQAQSAYAEGLSGLLRYKEGADKTTSPIDNIFANILLDAWRRGGQAAEDISGVDVVPGGRPDIDPGVPGDPRQPQPVARVINDNPELWGQPVEATVNAGPNGERYQVAPPEYTPLVQTGSRQTPPYINGESGVYTLELFAIDGNFGFQTANVLDLPPGKYEMVIDCEMDVTFDSGSPADMSIGAGLLGESGEYRPVEQPIVVGDRHRYVFGFELDRAWRARAQWFVVVRWATAAAESKAVIRALEISRVM